MKTKRLVSLDWAMKRLLRSKSNFKILEGFLTELIYKKDNDKITDEKLKKELKIIEILESESNQEDERDKFNRVDIKIKNSDDEIILVELQFDSEYDYFHRMLYGTAKAIAEHMTLGDEYETIKKVISVNIVYFDLGLGEDYIYYGKTHFRGVHKNDELELTTRQKNRFNKTLPHEIYPEYYIIKVNKFDNIAKDTLDEWIYFFKTEKVKSNFSAKGLDEARETLSFMSLDDDEKLAYDRYIEDRRYKASIAKSKELDLMYDKKDAREEGIKEGFELGEKKKEKEIAKSLLDVLDIETISLKTGLSIEEIIKLKD